MNILTPTCLLAIMTVTPLSVMATQPIYCPNTITCTIGSNNNVTNCSNLPTGWKVTSETLNGPNNFTPGKYSLHFSFATSQNHSSNANYVVKSQDTSLVLIVTFTNNNWIPTTSIGNFWKMDGAEQYCFAKGIWYDKFNNPLSCPFEKSIA